MSHENQSRRKEVRSRGKGTRKNREEGKVGKHAGHALIEWLEKHVDAMTSIKLPSDATPFKKNFKKIKKNE